MYAVIKSGGKQYKVAKDEVVKLEKLEGDPGKKVSFGDVLLVSNEGKTTVGAPLVKGASVEGEIVSHGRADKILVIKKKRRKGYHRKKGHRQNFTAVKITGISA
jgi:large subunit ribosomal protein L21